MNASFQLASDIDADALAKHYAEFGAVSIEPFLEEGFAEQLYSWLRNSEDWRRVINSSDKLFEFDRSTQANLTADQKAALDNAVYANARRDFQFRYETIRVPDDSEERRAANTILNQFALGMSSGETRQLLRHITGDEEIIFADSQATAYSPGDFLTRHDDDVEGKNRSAAYVLNLCPEWRVEWGGLFLMHGEDGKTARALIPGYNRLNLFRVPQMHSVSEVTRATPFRRYAVTGWLRRQYDL